MHQCLAKKRDSVCSNIRAIAFTHRCRVIKKMEDRVTVVNSVARSLEPTFKMIKLKWALTAAYPDIGSVFSLAFNVSFSVVKNIDLKGK